MNRRYKSVLCQSISPFYEARERYIQNNAPASPHKVDKGDDKIYTTVRVNSVEIALIDDLVGMCE